jgi:glycosyltransferase involved in cell wall biosynthesis
METISVIVPTRNRPEWVRRLWESAKDTASVMPEFCTYIDDDDVLSIPICEELDIKYRQGPRRVYTQNYNEAAVLSTGSILFDVADDFVFREKNWDLKIIAEFDKVRDKLILVHGFDGTEGTENATHFFVHRRWVNALGYLFPPYFRWANADVWMTKVANMVGRKVYLPYMIVEHFRCWGGLAPADSTFREQEENIRKYAWADIEGFHSLEDRKVDIERDAWKIEEAIKYYAEEGHSDNDYKPSNRGFEEVCKQRRLEVSSSGGSENTQRLEPSRSTISKPLRARFVR